MKLYLDANTIIYGVEGVAGWRDGVTLWTAQVDAGAGLLITSKHSRLECRVLPLRQSNQALLSTFDAFFSRDNLVLLDISGDVLEQATDLRARYRFRTPDAIHLATAVLVGADAFLTGDDDLKRCTEVRVEIVTAAGPMP
jgi:uncharacterized protein